MKHKLKVLYVLDDAFTLPGEDYLRFAHEDELFHVTEFERGHLYLSIAEEGKEPVFSDDFYNFGYKTYEIQNDGHYTIEISGKKAIGIIDVTIREAE